MISREKNSCKEIPGEKNSYTEKNISFMAYNPGKKNLTPLYVGEKEIISPQVWRRKIITQTKSPIPSPTPLKGQMVGS